MRECLHKEALVAEGVADTLFEVSVARGEFGLARVVVSEIYEKGRPA